MRKSKLASGFRANTLVVFESVTGGGSALLQLGVRLDPDLNTFATAVGVAAIAEPSLESVLFSPLRVAVDEPVIELAQPVSPIAPHNAATANCDSFRTRHLPLLVAHAPEQRNKLKKRTLRIRLSTL